MGNSAKQLRGQLRQLVKELMPELMQAELFTQLQQENRDRLELIAKDVRQSLEDIAARQKDVQNMIMKDLYAQVKTAPASEK